MLSLQGAEAPLSGLIAMLAAAEILGNSTHAQGYERRLVFAALAGEPWGYMGSKRFLWELHKGENSTKPLSLLAVDQVGACPAIYLDWKSPHIILSSYPISCSPQPSAAVEQCG